MSSQQQALLVEDENRAGEIPLAPATVLPSSPSSPSAAAQVEDSSLEQSGRKVADLGPPDDILSPPPEPKIIDSVSA